MLLDARKLPAGTVLDADICIVGAGPAGLTVAHEFVNSETTLLMFESGGLTLNERVQELNEGAVIGDPYAGLRQTRWRQVGGAAHLWNTSIGGQRGAKYTPLDPWDFDKLSDAFQTQWPLEYSELEPFYRRAHIVCGLGPFTYEGQDWADAEHPLLPLTVNTLSTKIYQCGVNGYFTDLYPKKFAKSDNIRLCHHAAVRGLNMQDGARQAIEAAVVSWSGIEFRARARIFVLAAGAIENARLLLLSGNSPSQCPGNKHDWVGRCFMEHPRDYALTLTPRSAQLFDEAVFYDLHRGGDGTIVGGRIALDSRTIRSAGIPNASITLMPRPRLAFTRLPQVMTKITRYLRRFIKAKPSTGYGWSHRKNLAHYFDVFQLVINIEQRPDPKNRIVLAQKRDRFGMPQTKLFWRWNDSEQANLERLRQVIAAALHRTGIGKVDVNSDLRPDPNAHHHAGTTRMHTDPRWGVVDASSRVHGTENLYVTGASIFCRAGFANPTLTIVALALRLADHLKQRL